MAEAKTQAVGAAVAVLLTASGVAAAIGVFEAQEHRSAIGWFTCCAACIIAATLIPIVVFVFFPWIKILGTRGAPAVSVRSTNQIDKPIGIKPQISIQIPPAVANGRIVVNVTPRFLAELHKDHMTSLEAEAATERYIGKWMAISGLLADMSYENRQRTILNVTVEEFSEPIKKRGIGAVFERIERQLGIITFLHFNDKKWIERLTVLNGGDEISALGQIAIIDRHWIRLDNCELILKDEASAADSALCRNSDKYAVNSDS
jgi:hypothetical protein